MFVMYYYYMFLFTSGYENQCWRGEDHQLGEIEGSFKPLLFVKSWIPHHDEV